MAWDASIVQTPAPLPPLAQPRRREQKPLLGTNIRTIDRYEHARVEHRVVTRVNTETRVHDRTVTKAVLQPCPPGESDGPAFATSLPSSVSATPYDYLRNPVQPPWQVLPFPSPTPSVHRIDERRVSSFVPATGRLIDLMS